MLPSNDASAAAAAAAGSSGHEDHEFQDRVVVAETLKNPVGCNCTLLQCLSDRRTPCELRLPGEDTEVEVVEGSVHACKNGIRVTSADIPGWSVLLPDARSERISVRVHLLERLDSAQAKAYTSMRESTPNPYTCTLREMFSLVPAAFGEFPSIRLERRFRHFIQSTDETKGTDWDRLRDVRLCDMSDEDYVCLAAHFLFDRFIGGKHRLYDTTIEEEPVPVWVDIGPVLFGQNIWWMLHLAFPVLNEKYRRCIAKHTRPTHRNAASAFFFNSGEGFATDFWVAWQIMMESYTESVRRSLTERFTKLEGSVEAFLEAPGPFQGQDFVDVVAKGCSHFSEDLVTHGLDGPTKFFACADGDCQHDGCKDKERFVGIPRLFVAVAFALHWHQVGPTKEEEEEEAGNSGAGAGAGK